MRARVGEWVSWRAVVVASYATGAISHSRGELLWWSEGGGPVRGRLLRVTACRRGHLQRRHYLQCRGRGGHSEGGDGECGGGRRGGGQGEGRGGGWCWRVDRREIELGGSSTGRRFAAGRILRCVRAARVGRS